MLYIRVNFQIEGNTPFAANYKAVPELIMGPCRDFGELSLEDVARFPEPLGLTAYIKRLLAQLEADGAVRPEDAASVTELVNKMSAAPGYMRFLGADKKRDEALRLYDIARNISPVDHPMRDDMLLAIVILIYMIDPSRRLISSLSGLEPSDDSGPLSYEYHAILAMNHLLQGSLDAAASHAGSALGASTDPEKRAYINILQACISLRKGDPESAVRYLGDGASRNERLRSHASFYAGIVCFDRKEYGDALKYFEASGSWARDVLDILAARCNVGACAVSMGDMGMGEDEFGMVGRLVRRKNGPRAEKRMLLANSYLGIISRAHGEYGEAEGYYKKALKSCVQLNYAEGIANQLGNMGILYRYTGDIPMALRLLNTCLLYSERMGYLDGIRLSCENIYRMLSDQGQAQEARKFKELYAARYPGLDF